MVGCFTLCSYCLCSVSVPHVTMGWPVVCCEFGIFRHQGYKIIPSSTHLSTNLILLITVKIPTIVGILTFISIINATSERLTARNFFICRYLSFYERLEFRTQLNRA